MPRKLRRVKPRIDVPLAPAARYYFLVGTWAPSRVKGWVELAQHEQWSDMGAMLKQHRANLLTEATEAGFIPHFVTGKKPSGGVFDAWANAFVEQHRY